MTNKDRIWGALLVMLSLGLLYKTSSFPSLPGQLVGAGTFPEVIATLLGVCGILLFFTKDKKKFDQQVIPNEIQLRVVISLVSLFAVPLFCSFFSSIIGFTLSAAIPTGVLMISLRGGKWLQSVFLSALLTSIVFVVFTKALLVPLADGPLGTPIGF
ncbi:tripartite tricarboxylate transporter TctB family protein [Polycladidibacter stylochi]|uniref:tripartite tricarboxylate transporter TctB family protein n=1 Tax=Polycladidibacter stylochi TaxID=1807766 RepID=UPI00082DF26A|nr:tripartite tricarboxylate transporter TctB family protein [Pseudovibrio stylochi]